MIMIDVHFMPTDTSVLAPLVAVLAQMGMLSLGAQLRHGVVKK